MVTPPEREAGYLREALDALDKTSYGDRGGVADAGGARPGVSGPKARPLGERVDALHAAWRRLQEENRRLAVRNARLEGEAAGWVEARADGAAGEDTGGPARRPGGHTWWSSAYQEVSML